MYPRSRRWLWTAALLLASVATGAAWLMRSPGAAPVGDDAATTRGASTGDAPRRAAADTPSPDGAAREGLGAAVGEDAAADLPAVDFGDDTELSGQFEPPADRRIYRWELLRDSRAVGSLRAEVAPGQEGMVELRFRVRTAAGTDRGSVTTVPRLFHRYARLSVEAESGSRLPLLTVLAPPALRAVLAALEAAEGGGERRSTATVADGTEVESVVVPGRLFPVSVRTTLPDGTVLEARPPGGTS